MKTNGSGPDSHVKRALDKLLGRTSTRRDNDQRVAAALTELHGLRKRIKSLPPPPEPDDRVSVVDLDARSALKT